MSAMRQVAREALLRVLRGVRRGDEGPVYRVLVLDERAMRVLGACLKMNELTQEGVALVEALRKRRQPFPEMEAVYLMDADGASVERLLDDFAEESATPQYKCAHVFTLQRWPDDLLGRIRTRPALIRRLRTLTEVNMNFLAVESNLFHFDMDTAFVELYNDGKRNAALCKARMVDALVTFCATMNEYPYVRYSQSSELGAELANSFQERMNTFIGNNTAFWWRGDSGDGHGGPENRATLVIVDRGMDAKAPLLHDFGFRPLVEDVLNKQDEACVYYKDKGNLEGYDFQDEDPRLLLDPVPEPGSNLAVCLLNDDNPLWTDFRLLHVIEIHQRIKEYIEEQKKTAIGQRGEVGKEGQSLESLAAMVHELPEFGKKSQNANQQVNLAQLCMKKVTKRRLLECGKVEQIMVTGVDEHGVEVSGTSLVTPLMELVRDPAVPMVDTARLIALYMLTQPNLVEKDVQHLIEEAKPDFPPEARKMLGNLSHLGALPAPKPDKKTRKAQLAEAKEIAENSPRADGRYVYEAGRLAQRLLNNALLPADFPYVIDPPPGAVPSPSAAAASTESRSGFFSAWRKRDKAGNNGNGNGNAGVGAAAATGAPAPAPHAGAQSVRSRPRHGANMIAGGDPSPVSAGGAVTSARPRGARLIIFFAGGVAPAELLAVRKAAAETNREVIVGATHIQKPRPFVQELRYLDSANMDSYYARREALAKEKEELVQARLAKEAALRGSGDLEEIDADGVAESKSNAKSRGGLLSIFSCGCMSGPPAAERPAEQA